MIQLVRPPCEDTIFGASQHSTDSSTESLFNRHDPAGCSVCSLLKAGEKECVGDSKIHFPSVVAHEKEEARWKAKRKRDENERKSSRSGILSKVSVPSTSLPPTVLDNPTSSESNEPIHLPEEKHLEDPVERELTFFEVCRNFCGFIRELGIRKILWAFFLSLLVIGGQAMQLIFLNFWLREYPKNYAAGNYTTFFISSFLFPLFFLIWLTGYFVVKRPKSIRFMKDRQGLALLFGIGSMDTINSILATYSANHANEVLEAVFSSVGPPLTAAVSRLILNERRTIRNPWFLVSLLLVVGGVFLASAYEISDSQSFSSDTGIWTFLFFLSIPPNVFLNCWQARYLILFTKSKEFEEKVIEMHVMEEEGEKIVIQTDSASKEKNNGGHRKILKEEDAAGVAAIEKGGRYTHHVSRSISGEVMNAQSQRSNVGGELEEEKNAGRVGANLPSIVAFKNSLPLTAGEPCSTPTLTPSAAGCLSYQELCDEDCFIRDDPAILSSSLPAPSSSFFSFSDPPLSAPVSFYESPSASAEECIHKKDLYKNYAVHYPGMQQSNDMLVKLWMLLGDTTVQFLQTVLLLPADALPWWGGSSSVPEAATNLGKGLGYFFTYKYNFVYGMLYSAGFIFTYIGSAYLNQYSPTLCSIVVEMSSPMTALLLIIIPAINLSGSPGPIAYSLSATVILLLGTILYTVWDYSTKAQKEMQEFQLKYCNVKTEVTTTIRPPRKGEECSFSEFVPYTRGVSSSSSSSDLNEKRKRKLLFF